MEKILKKYTTIPVHLYVERNADIQLRNIIKEMQRPGYVLVARQMGKTNLLFNAKRTLENEARLFVYVDLSNSYENERECYRNIINNIIEPNLDLFEHIENEIEILREKELPAHNEYSRSLRLVLNYFNGDLVIILDEIDALKSVDYSDNIFAQIRSNYFSRTNFPVFERLTYVLSGVIEPTELIKDRNKSPFNIGDKIYLDDFTKDEHDIFIIKSKLNITSEISSEIFNWTNGNPRLTFDICSEIEEQISEKKIFDIEKLNSIIKKKYLTHFDIAPIDHIRELVKTNKLIRKSITQIHTKKSSEISDEIKKRLYLYGIINSKFDEETEIKNKIIEQSLSEEWIKSIDKEKEISLVYALAKYHDEEYADAIEIFENVLTDSNPSKSDIEACFYFTGISYFKLDNYKKAIENFEKNLFADLYSTESKSYYGICKIITGEKDLGIKVLEEVIEEETNNYTYHNALYNVALNIQDADRSFNLFARLFDSTFKSQSEEEEELNRLRRTSLYHQAELLIQKNQNEEALAKINNALEYSTLSDSLYLNLLSHQINEIKDISIKNNFADIIIANDLRFVTKNISALSFTEDTLLDYLAFVFDESNLASFEKLLNYSLVNLALKRNKFELIYDTKVASIKNKIPILIYLLKFESEINDDLLKITYKDLAYYSISEPEMFLEYFYKFLPFFSQDESIENTDIFLFAIAIKQHLDFSKTKEALNLCRIIDQRVYNIKDENLRFESSIIYYWYTNLFISLNDKTNILKYADLSLNLINSSNRKKSSMIGEEGINKIKEQLIEIKALYSFTKPILRHITATKKHNRNDIVKVRYIDNSIAEKKYKLIEPDLKSGKCEII